MKYDQCMDKIRKQRYRQKVIICSADFGLLVVQGTKLGIKCSCRASAARTLNTVDEYVPAPIISIVVRESHLLMGMTVPSGDLLNSSSLHICDICVE